MDAMTILFVMLLFCTSIYCGNLVNVYWEAKEKMGKIIITVFIFIVINAIITYLYLTMRDVKIVKFS